MLAAPISEKANGKRKHPVFSVIVTYIDDGKFRRLFSNLVRAEKYAARQEKSSVVKNAVVKQVHRVGAEFSHSSQHIKLPEHRVE